MTYKKHPRLTALQSLGKQSEESLHMQIASFLSYALDDDIFWTTIENSNQQGGRSGYIKQGKLKAKGVRAGLPDIVIFNYPRILWLEVKTKKGRLSANQEKVHEQLRAQRHNVAVVRSIDDVEDAFVEHNISFKARLM